jgi:hypothetical protein
MPTLKIKDIRYESLRDVISESESFERRNREVVKDNADLIKNFEKNIQENLPAGAGICLFVDPDEGGQMRWGPQKAGEIELPSDTAIPFEKYASIYLVKQRMTGSWDPDSIIGKFDVLAGEKGKGSITRDMPHSQGNYHLTYEVSA